MTTTSQFELGIRCDDEFELRLLTECSSYDEGHRHALRQQLRTLLELAQQQAKRSAETARLPAAGKAEEDAHHQDAVLAKFLQRVANQ